MQECYIVFVIAVAFYKAILLTGKFRSGGRLPYRSGRFSRTPTRMVRTHRKRFLRTSAVLQQKTTRSSYTSSAESWTPCSVPLKVLCKTPNVQMNKKN